MSLLLSCQFILYLNEIIKKIYTHNIRIKNLLLPLCKASKKTSALFFDAIGTSSC